MNTMLLELRIDPLRFHITAATGEQYSMPLNAPAAQGLALALLAQTDYSLLPETVQSIMAEAKARVREAAALDADFLKTAGVALNDYTN